MVELAPGSRVFLYQSNVDIAAKKTASAACSLLSCFFPNSELIEANLTGANGKKKLPSQIIDAIAGKHSTSICFQRVISHQLHNMRGMRED